MTLGFILNRPRFQITMISKLSFPTQLIRPVAANVCH